VSRSLHELLGEALTHFEMAVGYASAEDLPQVVVDATSLRISAGIEVLNRVDPSIRTRMFGDNWQLMWGMRNRIAHGYLLVDADIIRQTVSTDLPTIIEAIRQALALP